MRPEPISIVIPTYNRSKLVTRAIESVLAQTYPHDAFEVIVVDDGSSDGTSEIIQRLYGDRIRLLSRASNSGVSAARNVGIDAANYDLIAFLDSDDIWFRQKLEKQVETMQDKRVVLCYSNWFQPAVFGSIDRFSTIGLRFVDYAYTFDTPLQTLLRPQGSGIWTSTCIVRKEHLRRCGGFDERMKICEDLRLWIRLATQGSFVALQEPLVQRGNYGTDNLTLDAGCMKDVARHRLEIFWEAYAHISDGPADLLELLRPFIAKSLYEQALIHLLNGHHKKARRKAMESFAFRPDAVQFLKALAIVITPSAARYLWNARTARRFAM